jgi:hypothetical protein
LADVLRAQAADVREARKRNLLEIGGRKEIAMMVPTNIWCRYTIGWPLDRGCRWPPDH